MNPISLTHNVRCRPVDHLNNLSTVFMRACIVVFWAMCVAQDIEAANFVKWVLVTVSMNYLTPSNWSLMHVSRSMLLSFAVYSHLKSETRDLLSPVSQWVSLHWKRNFWMVVYNVYNNSNPIPMLSHCNPWRRYKKANKRMNCARIIPDEVNATFFGFHLK